MESILTYKRRAIENTLQVEASQKPSSVVSPQEMLQGWVLGAGGDWEVTLWQGGKDIPPPPCKPRFASLRGLPGQCSDVPVGDFFLLPFT
jgi:hypothetical protein